MKTNLKKILAYKNIIILMQKYLEQFPESGDTAKKFDVLIEFYETIEADLAGMGECIIELDKPRLEAIAERDREINFNNNAYDI